MPPASTVLWLDGCFDGFHRGIHEHILQYAHANALRQALALVRPPVRIIVGVHSDAEITRNKGPPLFDEQERYAAVAGCRWVSRVVEDVPYVTQTTVFENYGVDYIVHGDDPVFDADGNDCYAVPKALGKFKEIKRTDGISTTSLIDRVLHPNLPEKFADPAQLRQLLRTFADSCEPSLPIYNINDGRLEISVSQSPPQPRCLRVAYIGGSWDCFGAGNIELLRLAKDAVTEKARPSGGENVPVTLVVGIWSDEISDEDTKVRPLLSLYERALSVAQCRYTDAIILSAPRVPPDELLRSLSVSTVISLPGQAQISANDDNEVSYIALPHTSSSLKMYTPSLLRERVLSNKTAYAERQSRKGTEATSLQ